LSGPTPRQLTCAVCSRGGFYVFRAGRGFGEGHLVDLDKSRHPTFESWVWVGISHYDSPLILRSPGGLQLYALDLEYK
jgi:hypothetical protein